MVACLKLSRFGPPLEELASTVDGEVPEWIDRLYESYGTSADRAPASASVLDEIEAQAQLEVVGVWVIGRQHAPVDRDGNDRWSQGLLP